MPSSPVNTLPDKSYRLSFSPTETETDRFIPDCVGMHDNDGDYDDNAIECFDPFVDVCAEEDVVVTVAGEEDAMFGSDSIITPYKLSRNARRYTRLLQMADSEYFK